MKKLIILFLVFITTNLSASGIPTVDVANIVQTTISAQQAVQQYEQLVEAYQRQFEELQEAIKQVEAITGSRDISGLLNGALEKEFRRYVPPSWEVTLDILANGGNPGSAADVKAYYDAIANRLNLPDAKTYSSDDAGNATEIGEDYENLSESVIAGSAIADANFANTPERILNYESLIDQIDTTADIKASSDLNTRVAAENGLMQTEIIRMLALQAKQDAVQSESDLIKAKKAAGMMRLESSELLDIKTYDWN